MGIDLDEKMVEFEPDRHLTDLGKKVTDWSKTLPVTGGAQGIPGKRQQAAVCSGFIYKFGDFEIEDFMPTADYNHVMAANGPPRYDTITGTYYDYGAYENGHPSGEIICTNPDLLVVKGSKDGVVPEEPPPGFVPGTPGNERPERPERDGNRDERKAERDASKAERKDDREADQAARQAERDARRDERKD
jgi:hypothetical protein